MKTNQVWYLIVFMLALVVISMGIYVTPSDITTHSLRLQSILTGEIYMKPHFLYYSLLALVTGFSTNLDIINLGALLILVATVCWRYHIYVQQFKLIDRNAESSVLVYSLALAALLVFNLPVNLSATIKLGQISPTQWHNSTWIFAMPFALFLFFQSLRLLESSRTRDLVVAIIFVFLSLVSKPNFFLGFAIAYPLFALLKTRSIRKLSRAAALVGSGMVVLLLQYLYYYDKGGTKAHVAVAPFEAWHVWSENVPLSFVASFFAPLLFLAVYRSKAWKVDEIKLASLTVLVSLIIYVLFAEYFGNSISVSNNFGWGPAMASNILFLVIIKFMFNEWINKQRESLGFRVVSLALAMHLLVGIVYILKYPIWGFR